MRKIVGLILALLVTAFSLPVHAESAPSLSEVVSRVSPSVVGITVMKREPPAVPGEPAMVIIATGSGFAVRAGGYILSNAHVLDHAISAYITASDGKIYPVDPTEIWADPVSDLAVAKIDADLPPIVWADLKQARLGDPVFAVGAPFGLRFRGSVSRGIISGFERSLDADYTFIQTDAPINPGNSGGPLFNQAGQVLGINARAIRGADGMGFAIPGDKAMEIVDQLIRDGKVDRAWLGLRFEESEVADLGWTSAEGPMVTMVEADGPMAQSGIQAGDTLISLNGTPVRTLEEVGAFLRSIGPGTPVKLTYLRGDQETTVDLRASARPHDADLRLSAAGLWVELTPAQLERARWYGRQWSALDAGDLADPWTTYAGDAKAVLVTEYLAVVRQVWASERNGTTLNSQQIAAGARKNKDLIEIQVDLPTRFVVGTPDQLWAEWEDEAGTVRAASVQVSDGAPPGFQRVVIRQRSDLIEPTGVAVLVLHLNGETSRRFEFDLDQLH